MRQQNAKPSMNGSKKPAQIVTEWLCHYAQAFRDGASMPAQISAATVEAYLAMLGGCSDAAILERAMRVAGEKASYFPRPKDIRQAYEAMREGRPVRACSKCEGDGYLLMAVDRKSHRLEKCPFCSGGAGEKGEKA